MARLNDKHKAFLVQQLATFATPSEARDALNETFGLTVGLDQVVFYNPTTANGERLAEKWKALFRETRERFKAETGEIAIANKAYRLRELQRIIESTRSPKLKMEAMEQAAKEVGDVYTNRRSVSMSGRIDWASLTDDQLDAIADGKDPAEVIGGIA